MRDYLWIFRKFNEHGIRYVVVGGIAMNLHGVPRMTYDLDVLLDLKDDNLRAFLSLLKSWGFKPKVPVDIMDFADGAKREEWIRDKNMKAFNLVNPGWAISEIDVIIDAPVDYEEAKKGMTRIALEDVAVPLISAGGLIKMKEAAGRKQDKSDILAIKGLSHEKG
ncbi:MAG: hypothetical protein HY894_07300 [Deltaproteobacteria bacterium]|nr:hypothetical protein [Deltaproteobacteria bacterium]